jgi:hypothetical protein
MTASSLFMAPILLTEQWVIRTARDDKHHSKRGTLFQGYSLSGISTVCEADKFLPAGMVRLFH